MHIFQCIPSLCVLVYQYYKWLCGEGSYAYCFVHKCKERWQEVELLHLGTRTCLTLTDNIRAK